MHNVRVRGDVKRSYLSSKQLNTIKQKRLLKKRKFIDDKQVPTGVVGWVHTGFSDLSKEDESYKAKKAVGDTLTELFFKTMFNKDDIFFLYMTINAIFKSIGGVGNILIKGGAVLSIFRESLSVTETEITQDLCKEFIEDLKPKIADLDVIVPYPDEWVGSNEKVLDIGYKVYKKFNEYWEPIMNRLAKSFMENEEVLKLLKVQLEDTNSEFRKNLLLAMKIGADHKNLDFNIKTTKAFSTYTRQLEDFYSESYKQETEGESFISCGLVEGIVMPTSMITPLVFDLCRIILNFNISCEGRSESINVKLGFVDMPFQRYSTIKDSNTFGVQVELRENDMNELKKNLYRDKLLDGNVHTITVNHAVNEDIRDMLYRRNYFVFEDTKYEKRLRRDILYNALLLYKKAGVNRVKHELGAFRDSLISINECLEDKHWLKCLHTKATNAKLPSRLYQHIMDSIKSMSGILLGKLPEYLCNAPSLVEEYKDELRTFVDRVSIDADYTHRLFTHCTLSFK